MTPDELITKWAPSGGAENANAQHFVIDLCDMLGVPRPDPTQPNDAVNDYVFEKSVRHVERGVTTTNRIDCYKRDRFILESKQSSLPVARAAKTDSQGELLPEAAAAVRGGTARRGTAAWDRAMRRAYGQARDYVADLPPDHAAPPFLVVVDVGHVIELYADFSGRGRNYNQFPDRRAFQITLEDLREEAVRERLRLVWTDPRALDPAIRAAEVTRDVAERLARVARRLEGQHEPATVATFLMRCLFTMFAEDVGLIPHTSFTGLLKDLKERPDTFVPALEHLWRTMDEGGFEPRTAAVLKRFNGALFKERTALPLDREGIHELHVAAQRDWRDVEPAIFGTLLERALDPAERARLGAHYTPRAYVERLVVPTVIEPLRADWQEAQAAVAEAVDARDEKRALAIARNFHHKLCTTRVLDPACGTGNFLYVALELMKRLEGEVLETVRSLTGQDAFEMSGETVDPAQFLGLELNPRAVAIADLVVWLGYLKWQLQNTRPDLIPEPVLHAYGTIREADAVLAYDEAVPRVDAAGAPVTLWDGRTMKPSPITGLPVPDETARVQAYTYRTRGGPSGRRRSSSWATRPSSAGRNARSILATDMPRRCGSSFPKVPGGADFVMQWWDQAAISGEGWPRRHRHSTPARWRDDFSWRGWSGSRRSTSPFRLHTTNSITQTFSQNVWWSGTFRERSAIFRLCCARPRPGKR